MAYTIAILLPGTTGSTLVAAGRPYNDSNPVWPNQVKAALEAINEKGALNLLTGTLYAGTPTYGSDPQKPSSYNKFIQYFKSLNFQYVEAQTPQTQLPLPKNSTQNWGLPASLNQNLLIGFAYDWRLDNTTGAQTLQNLLYNIERLYGGNYKQLYLIAHSMGGIVSRAYLETSISQGDPWLGKIKSLITLGTPHLGSPLALGAIIGQLPFAHNMFLLDTLARQFLSTSQYSASTYELLPPLQAPTTLAQFISVLGQSQSYSIFDTLPPEVTKYLTNKGLNPTYLAQAKKFFGNLNYNGSGSLPPYYCVYGLVANAQTLMSYAYHPDIVAPWWSHSENGVGDEIVLQGSASFSGRKVSGTYEASGVNHDALPGDPGVQKQVATWMGLPT